MLVWLATFSVLFASFSSSDYLNWLQFITTVNHTNTNVYSETYSTLWYPSDNWYVCFNIRDWWWNSRMVISFNGYNNRRYITDYVYTRDLFWCFWYATNWWNYTLNITDENWAWLTFVIDLYYLPMDYSITSWNPWYTSLQCQTEYNLIPIESVDSNYCTTNNLCPVCPSCPVWSWSLSNVYINNILHVGAPNIIMNIPEEIDWDYAYTQWWNNMNIDIVWYNVDYEKMQEVIDIQNYKPWSEDLNNVITSVVPLFVPWLCIILLLYFIFRFIKKVF